MGYFVMFWDLGSDKMTSLFLKKLRWWDRIAYAILWWEL